MGIILLVVADKAALTAGDVFIQNRLTSMGHTVTLRSDEEAELTTGYDGIFTSDSCSSGTLSPKYGTITKPAITSEFPTGWGLGTLSGGANTTTWTVNAGTALSAGLSGTQTVYSVATGQDGAASTNVGDGVIVATHGATNAVAPVVYWDTGVAMATGQPAAPARRVLFRVGDANIANVLTPALSILDAAIDWAYGTVTAPTGVARTRAMLGLL